MSEFDFLLALVGQFGWPAIAVGGIAVSLMLWVRSNSQIAVIEARANARIVEAMAKQLDGLQAQVAQMSSDLAGERRLNDQMRGRIEQLERNVIELRGTIEDEQAQNKALKAENSQLTQQIIVLKAQGCT